MKVPALKQIGLLWVTALDCLDRQKIDSFWNLNPEQAVRISWLKCSARAKLRLVFFILKRCCYNMWFHRHSPGSCLLIVQGYFSFGELCLLDAKLIDRDWCQASWVHQYFLFFWEFQNLYRRRRYLGWMNLEVLDLHWFLFFGFLRW